MSLDDPTLSDIQSTINGENANIGLRVFY